MRRETIRLHRRQARPVAALKLFLIGLAWRVRIALGLAAVALLAPGCGVVTYEAKQGARVVVEPKAVRVYQDGIERCRVTAPKVEVAK